MERLEKHASGKKRKKQPKHRERTQPVNGYIYHNIMMNKALTTSEYDKFPVVEVPGSEGTCNVGWDNIARELKQRIESIGGKKTVLCIDCYPGVDVGDIVAALSSRLEPVLCVLTADALRTPEHIETLTGPYLRENDAVFGRMSSLELVEFFSPTKLAQCYLKIDAVEAGLVLVVGIGAPLVYIPDVFVYADLARWEAQMRFRANSSDNLGLHNRTERAALQYQRAFFIDWRVCDRWKCKFSNSWDYVLDTNTMEVPKLAQAEAVRRGLRKCVTRPFHVVPFFDPAPWGGEWMRQQFQLSSEPKNFGWCFDCVPEENSLFLLLDGVRFEIPSINLVFSQPEGLLGDDVYRKFGAEFPIRFDFLDTMEGGNLSFQVHPLTSYIHEQFGMGYTQDESYYLLDAGEDATVYLGLREGIDAEQMKKSLRDSQTDGVPFPAEEFVNCFPAKKHDHFLIPAGTCHCSGKNSMVLEISATPYIFTFKMWDWARLGLDGRPRPVHIEDGIKNIQWDRTTDWVKKNLVNRFTPIAQGDGWQEERTGLHELEFIETRRHWFDRVVEHDTNGTVNVLNLIEGKEIIVESPDESFEPFIVHYAETFIVPAAVGPYTIRPHGVSEGERCGTIKAYVRW